VTEFSKAIAKPAGLVVGGVLAVGLLWWLFGNKLKGAAAAVGTAINPTSDQNLAYKGVTAVGAAISGRDSWSLGSWIYDLTHDDANLASNPKPATADESSWWANLTTKIGGG
jgi:hypothetical protein